MNPWWLLLIVPASFAAGVAFLFFWVYAAVKDCKGRW